jgi:uncharacterized NAD(P)/FAD-binding protein YdhS
MEQEQKDLRASIITAADEQLKAAAALNRAVREARRAGLSWADVGDLLGTTRQAAQQRFGATTGRSGQ